MYRGCLFFAKRRVYNKRSELFQEASEHIYLRTEKLTVCPATVLFSCKVP